MTKSLRTGAIVLAAGRSVRFRSALSKLLHPIGGRPMIRSVVDTLRDLRLDPIVVVVGFQAEQVQAACGAGVAFARQAEPRGTGDAVRSAEDALQGFRGDLLVLSGDLPLLSGETLSRLLLAHRASQSVLTMTTAVVEDPSGWGRVVRRGGAVRRIVEEKDASLSERDLREVNVGIYVAAAEVLFPLLRGLTANNAQGEMYLTDIVQRALEAGYRVSDVRVDLDEVAQVNTRAELAALERRLRDRINLRWMTEGVTLEDPASTYIGPDVVIGRDTVIGPNVQLRGRTVLGERCRLDGTARLEDARLGDEVHVKLGVVMADCDVEAGCQIGPFAQVRPGTVLGPAVVLGNFVETKNTRLGARSKASHLTYLGDAEIGSETNIGAGTITCNYDGFRKHRTIIGDRVQVGSDSQLVAPVTLGDDVFVATGTTVREDVPAGSLVFNRKPEERRPGWVEARRQRERGTPAKPAKKPRSKPRSMPRDAEKDRPAPVTTPKKAAAGRTRTPKNPERAGRGRGGRTSPGGD